MARGGTMYARAARRAAMQARALSEANGSQPSDVSRITCRYCGNEFESQTRRDIHITLQPICNMKHEAWLSGTAGQKRRHECEDDSPAVDVMDRPPPTKQTRIDETVSAVAGPSQHANALQDPSPAPSSAPAPNPNPVSDPSATPNADFIIRAKETEPKAYTRDGIFIEPYPVSSAGASIGTRNIDEADLRAYLESCGSLGDPELFDTAQVMMTTGLSGRGRTRHLKAPAYKHWKRKGKAVWPDNAALLRDVDRLPTGPDWTSAEVRVGEGIHERSHTVHFRNILEVIREMLSARRFRRCLRFAPERHWTSRQKRCRVYGEMWTGEWWWEMQGRIHNKNGTVVPLIIASDETTLTNNAQGPKEHPIYLSIGNISKSVRRKPTKRSMVLIGYLPVGDFEAVTDKAKKQAYRMDLLHRSLEHVFEPLKTASSDGELAWCADGNLRHIYPLIAAWVSDYPEQNDIACTSQSGCPKCMQPWQGRSQGGPSAPLRDQEEIRETLRAYRRTKDASKLNRLRLRPVVPFWDGIPIDFGKALAPDLLHQLYKGMFEHTRDWVEDLLGTSEFNRRFKAMPPAQDLRHFKKGVTKVKVWAGRESRDMMRQLLPIVVDAKAPPKFVRLVRTLLDFSYLAHSPQLTELELAELDKALEAFHEAKGVLVNKENPDMSILKGEGAFDRLAKLHMLGHYTQDIRQLGTPDGYSTETPEHLHIMYVKIPWRMSNRRNPVPQMVKYVRRLEALEIQRVHIEEAYGEVLTFDVRDVDFDEDEGEEESAVEVEVEGDDEGDDEGGEGGEGDESEDEDSELEDGVEVEPAEQAGSEIVFYPRPVTSIARQPTVPRVSARVIASSYGATDFLRALRSFLTNINPHPSEHLILLPSDEFPLWHKAVLNHTTLPFAPQQPCHRDVLRVRPPARDAAGHVSRAGVFDTALFTADQSAPGLQRFRAGRVRAIFALPPDLEHLYSGPLVYTDHSAAASRRIAYSATIVAQANVPPRPRFLVSAGVDSPLWLAQRRSHEYSLLI
ncbi:hypothetical protein FRC09_001198 [Ceratobasidium sp. 395]|nr:hypothetical protein FRC09_001198 [Ceratobasidium sp. 395]